MTTLRDILMREFGLRVWTLLMIVALALVLAGMLGWLAVIAGLGLLMGMAGGLFAEREEARKKKEAKTDAQPPG